MNKLIALDADGVIFDYRAAFARAWQKRYGYALELKEPRAFKYTQAYAIDWQGEDEAHFFNTSFTEEAYVSMPLMSGAFEALGALSAAGNVLVIVTAMGPEFLQARIKSCELHGLPIHAVHATGDKHDGTNPKAQILNALQPAVFVDDITAYFAGLADGIHRAFINYQWIDCLSRGKEIRYHSEHSNLKAFADFWIHHRGKNNHENVEE